MIDNVTHTHCELRVRLVERHRVDDVIADAGIVLRSVVPRQHPEELQLWHQLARQAVSPFHRNSLGLCVVGHSDRYVRVNGEGDVRVAIDSAAMAVATAHVG